MPRDTVDQQPSAALPLPMRRRNEFLRKAVVDAEGAPHHKQAIRNIVPRANGEFPNPRIDQERSNSSVRLACRPARRNQTN